MWGRSICTDERAANAHGMQFHRVLVLTTSNHFDSGVKLIIMFLAARAIRTI